MRYITGRTRFSAAVALLALASGQPAHGQESRGTAHRAAGESAAYFEFGYSPYPGKIVFRLTDEAKIKEARDILSGAQKDRIHVIGRIIKTPAPYNPGWSFHLDPASISFFQVAIEVCDAAPPYVEDHLDEVGGAFLPGAYWCPWHSQLLREVPAPVSG